MAWLDWVELLTAKVLGKKYDTRRYCFRNAALPQFGDFAAAMSHPEDCELLDTYSFCGEVSNVCLMALGAEPSRTTLVEAVKDFAEIVEPTRFLALTVARSEIMDGVLSPVLSKRLRAYLHATLFGECEGPHGGPAPGEQPWEIVEALMRAKAEAAYRKRAAPANSNVLLLTKCRGRRGARAEDPSPTPSKHTRTDESD